jgi:hypothetical protein
MGGRGKNKKTPLPSDNKIYTPPSPSAKESQLTVSKLSSNWLTAFFTMSGMYTWKMFDPMINTTPSNINHLYFKKYLLR